MKSATARMLEGKMLENRKSLLENTGMTEDQVFNLTLSTDEIEQLTKLAQELYVDLLSHRREMDIS